MFGRVAGLASRALAAGLAPKDALLSGLPLEALEVPGDISLASESKLRRLPAKLVVRGMLDLRHCEGLEALPDGLSVAGSLILTGCDQIRHLPAGLKVGGDLILEGHPRLEELPEDLDVRGSILLDGCTALRRLPDPLRLRGSLSLRGCTSLADLPSLWLGGNLDIRGCASIKALRSAHRVERDILAADSGLAMLPAEMAPCRTLNLRNCKGIRKLPPKLRVSGDLILSDCTGLGELPDRLQVGGDLKLNGCAALGRLPQGLHVAGSLDLTGCAKLVEIPSDLKVGDLVRVTGCSSLRVLRGDLNFGENLDLSGCSSLAGFEPVPFGLKRIHIDGSEQLTALPKDLKADLLIVKNCPALAQIPQKIEIAAMHLINLPKLERLPAAALGGTSMLIIQDCHGLRELPPGMSLRHLQVSNCAGLRRIPSDFKALGRVQISRCPALETLGFTAAMDMRLDRFLDGFIDVESCHGLKVLVIAGSLHSATIRNCNSLTTVRGALSIGRLTLRNCRQLRTVEAIFTRLESLELIDCPELGSLPPSVETLERLIVRRSQALAQAPWRLRVSGWMAYEDMGSRPLPQGLFFNSGATLNFGGSEINPADPRLKGVQLRWRGVEADERFFHPERITPKDVLEEPNAARRAALFDRMGFVRFMAEAKAAIVDSDLDAGGRRELIRVPMPEGEPILGLKVFCPSTGHLHFLRVPPELSRCGQAAAWVAGFDNPEDYRPIKET